MLDMRLALGRAHGAWGAGFRPGHVARGGRAAPPLSAPLLPPPRAAPDPRPPASQVRPYCIAMVVARFGTIDDCLAIQDRDGEAAHTMRHACIDALASRLHE